MKKETNNSLLKVAVIGVGSMGRNHARILSQLEGVELVGIIDTDEERASKIAKIYHTKVLSSTTNAWGLDGVVVAAPTPLHRELATRYLEAGVGVLCEKPMATTLEDCDAILAARERSGAPLLVGHVEHFNPGVELLASRVDNPRFMEIDRLALFTPRSLDVDVILDLMIHDIEIAQSLVGKPVKAVEAVGVNVLTSYADIANARLVFNGGCVANLTASRISRKRERKLRLFQSKSYLSVDYSEQSVEHYRVEETEAGKTIVNIPAPILKKEPLLNELEHFARVLRGQESPRVNGEAAREAVAAARAILKCMES